MQAKTDKMNNVKNKGKKGVFLINLGTPKSPSHADVFHYLNEFLTDPRVIDKPWLKRQFLVRGVIVPARYRKSSEQYRSLWTPKGSPLLMHGKQVEQKLQEALGDNFHVVLGMRYQYPSIIEGIKAFQEANVAELIILPLFPQYASATTGSVFQKVMESLRNQAVFPKLVFINHFYDHPGLIQAFCSRAQQYPIESFDHILFSFHGLPENQIIKINSNGHCLKTGCCNKICAENHFCYKAQCHATARLISEQLKLNKDNYTICFQSRLGKEPWLQPYLSDVIRGCAAKGYQRLLVLSPSFVCDCLETTFEIAQEYNREFKRLGGHSLQLVDGLNNHPIWIETLKAIVLESICG